MRPLLIALLLNLSLPGFGQAQERSSYLPNPKLTPGAAHKVSKDELCGARSKSFDGSVPISLKSKVFDRYRLRTDKATPYNIDRLIPVSLGGTNAIENLWPQPLSGEWSYAKKNKLENRLHKLVCKGELDPEKAQQEISTDWVSAYKKYLSAAVREPSKQD